MVKKLMVVVPLVVALLLLPVSAVGPTDGDVGTSDLPETPEYVDLVDEHMELVETSVYSLSPITPDNTTGFTSVILSLIGDYDPVIVEYRYQNSSSSNYQYLREVQPDFPWLVSAGIFAIILFGFLRILGGVICKK